MKTLTLQLAARAAAMVVAGLAAGCASTLPPGPTALGADPAAACGALAASIAATAIGLPSGGATIDSARLVGPVALAVAERGATPAGRVTPALPAYCQVLGRIAPVDPKAPPILFQVNLPLTWNGRSLQYGGGGFNGSLNSALTLPPAQRFDTPAPLAQGFVTVGTDSGHQTGPTDPPQAFAANDEAFVNFAHASYKKVRDVSVALTRRAYGRAPDKLYFMGSSEGGREGLTLAQRYPSDFDGILSRVPVINWTGLMHVSTRAGLITQGDAWMGPAQVQRVHAGVLAACDAADGLADGLVANPVACKAAFDPATLQCAPGGATDGCLNPAQVAALRIYLGPWQAPFALANGVTQYPGWGVSGEATPAFGPTGGWRAWFTGNSAPTQPAKPDNGISWFFGSGAIRHIFMRDPNADVSRYRPEDHADRIRQVSALMDATNPDLSAFQARGGKLVVLEYMADFAQSPYAGIGYFESVRARMGRDTTDSFARLYTAPGVDHVGSGAPANVDMLAVLTDWVERGRAPGTLEVVEQALTAPFPVKRALPLCQWPLWPQYRGGDVNAAASFACVK